MRSIQRHLSARLLATVLAVAGITGSFFYLYVRARLTSEFDRALDEKARQVAGMAEWSSGKLSFSASEAEQADFRGAHPQAYFEIWGPDGTMFLRSPALGNMDLHPPASGPQGKGYELRLPNGVRGRAMEVRVTAHYDEDEPPDARNPKTAPPLITVAVAQNRAELDYTLRVLLSSLLLGALALIAGTTASVILSVRGGLRPLQKLAHEADTIDVQSIGRRFSQEGMPIELVPIRDRLNSLLERLEEAFKRERRFTADVAHELRTPIAELRSLAEVALKWPDPAAATQGFSDTLHIAEHMENMVTALLAIARCEAGRQSLNLQSIDLPAAVADAWKPLQSRATERRLRLQVQIPAGAAILSDRALLMPLISNLLSNAVTYGDPCSAIVCRLEINEGHGLLSFTNATSGLDAADLPHLFEPFWRKDTARTSGHHSGLGLALVSAYATALGMKVQAGLPEPRLFCIALSLTPAMQQARVPSSDDDANESVDRPFKNSSAAPAAR